MWKDGSVKGCRTQKATLEQAEMSRRTMTKYPRETSKMAVGHQMSLLNPLTCMDIRTVYTTHVLYPYKHSRATHWYCR